MANKDLNLSDFNIHTENIILNDVKVKKARKLEKLDYKMQIGLTKTEYDILYDKFKAT